MHVLRNAGRRVQRNRRPNGVDIRSSDALGAQESAGRIRSVDLEALLGAAVLWGKSHVMEHRPRIQELRIEAQVPLLSGQRTEKIYAARVMEEQRRFGIADQLGNLLGELAVGNAHPLHRKSHENLLSA